MSKRLLIAIVDKVSNDVVGPILLFRHPAPAVRMFDDAARDPRTQINQYTKDHALWQLGTFDDETMLIDNTERIELINGEQWLNTQPRKQENDQ